MSMLSAQSDELRTLASELGQMARAYENCGDCGETSNLLNSSADIMREAADTIISLRDRLQDIVLGSDRYVMTERVERFCGEYADLLKRAHGLDPLSAEFGELEKQESRMIAELVGELGSGACKITATATNNLMYPDYMTKWYELSCGHSLTLKGDEAPKWCAVCGKAVER